MSIQHPHFSEQQWLHIHETEAPGYQKGEWTRETLLGIKRLRKKAFEAAAGSILDVACGTGNNFAYLPANSPITAIDFSPTMLGFAQRRAQRLGLMVELKRMNVERLEFPDQSFDTVIAGLMLCSVQNPIAVLQEMRRVCRPDGQILLLEHGRSSVEWIGRYQDRRVDKMVRESGCRWNQEPQVIIQQAGLQLVTASRSLLGIMHVLQVM